jgi:hypothetical protein
MILSGQISLDVYTIMCIYIDHLWGEEGILIN